MKLTEVEPGRWRVSRETRPPARSDLPIPYVISDEMPPVEQVDGRFYTSKAAFRAVGRANGLTEVGTSKFPAKRRSTDATVQKQKRREALHCAIARYRAGERPQGRR